MKSIFIVVAASAIFAVLIDSQCIGNCIGGDCPTGYTCTNGVSCCLTTSTTTCVDLARSNGTSDCTRLSYLCNNSVYYTLMTQQCPRTCGRCSTSTSTVTTTCVDLARANGTSDCASVARLCNDANYYTLMTQQCPRTCGRCTVG
uniref:ShKT domain-containing protein n=1 Tax=Panagrolaimus sp. ES5 TaxID=591445 RepID=A0AC34GXM0_9BILA